MLKLTLAALAAFMLCACETPGQWLWTKYSVTDAQAQKDFAECNLMAMQNIRPDPRAGSNTASVAAATNDALMVWAVDAQAKANLQEEREQFVANCMTANGYQLQFFQQ